MNTCKTCKHWGKWKVGFITAHRLTNNDEWGCCSIFDGDDDGPAIPTSLAFAQASDDWAGAGLNTHSDFGCIQFEQKM